MEFEEIMERLKSLANPEAVKGMARFGINPKNNLGVQLTILRKIGKETGKNHDLAVELWESGIRDARMLAAIIDEPFRVTENQMERWVMDFDSWDVCDNCCNSLFSKTPFAYAKTEEWSSRGDEFVKRAGFVLLATLAVHDKKAQDDVFEGFFPLIERESWDDRNYVKKAVNWALRQIGKRNLSLNKKAIAVAERLIAMDFKAARWIGRDALRELTNEKTKERLRTKEMR